MPRALQRIDFRCEWNSNYHCATHQADRLIRRSMLAWVIKIFFHICFSLRTHVKISLSLDSISIWDSPAHALATGQSRFPLLRTIWSLWQLETLVKRRLTISDKIQKLTNIHIGSHISDPLLCLLTATHNTNTFKHHLTAYTISIQFVDGRIRINTLLMYKVY